MKPIVKRILYALAFVVIIPLVCFVLYLRFGAYFVLDKKTKSQLVEYIENAPAQSDRFYELYDLVYPELLDSGVSSYLFFNRLFYVGQEAPSSLHISYMPYYGLDQYLLAFYLEDKVSQKQCLNAMLTKQNFSFTTTGIKEASNLYFEKEVKDLSDRETLILILMTKNSSLYNPLRNPELVEEKVNEILENVKNKEDSKALMNVFNVL